MPFFHKSPTHIPFVFTSARRCARPVASLDELFAASEDSYLVEAPAETVHIPPPDVYHGFGPETGLRSGYTGEDRPYGDYSYRVGERLIGKFHDAEIDSATGFPFIDGNLVVSDFYHGPEVIATHWNPYITQANSDPNLRYDLLLRERPSDIRRLAEDVLSLDSIWNNYYYHFVIETLPKFLRLREDPRLAAVPVLWRQDTHSYVSQYLRALGFWDRLVPMAGDVVRCDRLFLPSVASPNGWTQQSLAALRDAVLPAFGIEPASRPHRLVLLSRRDALTRRIVNEGDLEAALAPLGFELVIPGALPIAEQIEMFANARLIVGPHGSAWANIVYAAPGTAMLEIQQQGSYHPAMYSIAKLRGVTYGGYAAEQPTPEGDMRVDVGQITRMVRTLLDLSPP